MTGIMCVYKKFAKITQYEIGGVMEDYSEEDTKAKILEPIIRANWDEKLIQRELRYTPGRFRVVGQNSSRDTKTSKKVDYILWKDRASQQPLAVIEAESNKHDDSYGMSQALDYAEDLNIPFVFASSGRNIWYFKNRITQEESTIKLGNLPDYDKLISMLDEQPDAVDAPYYVDLGETPREPMYYQRNAINAVVESIVRGQQKNLLVMATGTGKTYTAFQIIYRLLYSNTKKHVLYLADRDVLISQTMNNDFKPFVDKGIITRVGENPEKVETAYQIHMALLRSQ